MWILTPKILEIKDEHFLFDMGRGDSRAVKASTKFFLEPKIVSLNPDSPKENWVINHHSG